MSKIETDANGNKFFRDSSGNPVSVDHIGAELVKGADGIYRDSSGNPAEPPESPEA